jgi:hypothetical protein
MRDNVHFAFWQCVSARKAFQRSFIPQLPIRREVARVLKAALGLGGDEDDAGIFTMCVEIDDGQWAVGAKIPTLFQLLDNLGGNVSAEAL